MLILKPAMAQAGMAQTKVFLNAASQVLWEVAVVALRDYFGSDHH